MSDERTVIEGTSHQVSTLAMAPAAPAESGKHKRKQTSGEIIFNFGVYGGISWILNEILSTIITNTIYFASPEAKAKGAKDGMFAKTFNNIVDGMHGGLNPLKWGKTAYYLAAEMFVMCIGGNLLVAPTKWVEDRKGKIVRSLDKMLHGGKQDPKLEEAHKEMDNAPQQSWGSLVKGRLLVLVAAIGLHFVAGAEKTTPPVGTTGVKPYVAPSTRWLKGTFLEKYANLSRLMKTATRDILSMKWIPFISAEHKAGMKAARAMPGVPAVDKLLEGKVAHAMGNTFGYVLSVSAAMAALFYVSSHVFAALRDKNKDQKTPGQTPQDTALANADQGLPKREERPTDKKPSVQISQVENHTMMSLPGATVAVQQ